jgi:hypothetical protein
MKKLGLIALLLIMAAGTSRAQALDDDDEAQPQEPVRKIKVLENPYDIASFYRSSQGDERYFSYQAPYDFSDRYPIAAAYRSRQTRRGFAFAPFWTHGGRQPRLVVGYRRSLGRNADLFLIAPTFLAPVGPLSSAFLGH